MFPNANCDDYLLGNSWRLLNHGIANSKTLKQINSSIDGDKLHVFLKKILFKLFLTI